MIIRRLVIAVRRQDWFTVLIEFALVVAGVLVALQVNNWNEDRSDRQAYEHSLDRLRGEIVANFDMLDLASADIAGELPLVQAAYDALETCNDDAEMRQAINAGLMLLNGANTIRLRTSELFELTSSPVLLAQQKEETRRKLSDLRFLVELTLDSADTFAEYPRQTRPERIAALRPGKRTPQETTYLGLSISQERRSLELHAPVSAACEDADLIAALWAWDRYQGNLSFLINRIRQEYQSMLAFLEEEKPQ
ncbi:MAG: hypothetical protein AAF668_02735 [Pseudomonadota bacterium]